MKKNNTVEEINTSINNLLEEWNISDDHNEKVVTHIIGLQIKKIRLIQKKTQTRVAKIVNVSFQQIQKYEKGSNLPNPITLLALSEYFKVSFDFWIRPLLDTKIHYLTTRRDHGYTSIQDFMAR